jgi:GNAT superfamily N-acetyltransferase
MSLRIRPAVPDDAEGVALLHADSWRRHYRGAYSDSFLDGDIVADRLSVWTSRLATAVGAATFIGEYEDVDGPAGFVHVVFDDDAKWGSLLDNLHVTCDLQRSGIGSALMARAAQAVLDEAVDKAMYLWVQEQNVNAQRFYEAHGGVNVETAAISSPGGIPGRLSGSPNKLRMSWSDASLLAGRAGAAVMQRRVGP